MFISSGVIILNKQLLVDDGFNFPLALTATGQTMSCLLGEPCNFDLWQIYELIISLEVIPISPVLYTAPTK